MIVMICLLYINYNTDTDLQYNQSQWTS